MKKAFNIFIITATILSFTLTPFLVDLLLANPGYLVCLDPGHGGRDPGAVGVTGLMEKVVNLDIAYKVKSKLQAKGYSVVMTRTSDTYLSLDQRVTIANNKKATIFVSIHNNAFILPTPHGTETYYSSSGAPYGYYLADAIQQRVVANTGSKNRGTKDGGFYVLNHTNMPAALQEGEFLSNPDKEALLKTDSFRNKIAQGIYEGIINYLNKYGGGEPPPSGHYTPGKDLGYFIFKEADGVFKIRWSGNGPVHNFTGVITTDGKFTNVNKYAFTSEDSATVSTNKISFNAKAGSYEDGLDFKLSNATKITFNIKIDNTYIKDKVYIKESKNNPTSVPFTLDLNLAQIKTPTTPPTTPTLPTTTISNSTNMRGISSATKEQMLNMFKKHNPNKINRATRIVDLYIKWGNKFNIRVDIAWAQMCHETNFLKYDGIVPESANNFCGLGATGQPGVYNSFATEELGVIAHFAHLAWYVYPNHVNSYCSMDYDPRHFTWGASPPHNCNGDHTLNCLNGRWAPSSDYTYKIIKFANEIYN